MSPWNVVFWAVVSVMLCLLGCLFYLVFNGNGSSRLERPVIWLSVLTFVVLYPLALYAAVHR